MIPRHKDGGAARGMTLANRITLARLGLAFLFLLFIVIPALWSRVAAWGVYLLATSTDWLDGFIARRTRTVSSFGAMADPLSDKLLVAAAFVAFLGIRTLRVPAWAVFLIVAREFLIMGLRSLGAVRGIVLRAERWGKWKMGIQSACVLLILTFLVFQSAVHRRPDLVRPYLDRMMAVRLLRVSEPLPYWLTVLAAISAWASGLWYMSRYRDLITSSWRPSRRQGRTLENS